VAAESAFAASLEAYQHGLGICGCGKRATQSDLPPDDTRSAIFTSQTALLISAPGQTVCLSQEFSPTIMHYLRTKLVHPRNQWNMAAQDPSSAQAPEKNQTSLQSEAHESQ
jgi:hypothetical protein